MRKQLLFTTIFLSVILAKCQTDIKSVIFDKHKAEKLIIGHWKGVRVSAKCDQLAGFNDMMNNPMSKASFKALAITLNYEFRADKKLISGEDTEADTSKYEISDVGVNFFDRNEEKKLVKKQCKIDLITDDTLIYSKEVKTSDPNFLPVLKLLNAERDTNKTVTYTYTLYKIKEAKAPWTAVKNDLPANRKADNLVTDASAIFTILRGGYDRDSVFVSHDYGKHWTASLKGLPKLSGENPLSTSMAASGKKIFIGTPSGIFSSENSGQSWAIVNDISIKEGPDPIISIASTSTSVFALVDSQLYLSKDNGSTWNLKKPDFLQKSLMAAHLSASGTNIMIEGMEWGQPSFLFFSSDNGESWTDISEKFDDTEYPGIVSNSFITGATILMNTQYGMFLSKDKGANWHPGANGLPSDFSGNSIVENGIHIFYGSNLGVFLSVSNGESWVAVNNEKLRKGVESLAIIDSNIFALTTANEIYKASISELVNTIEKSKN